ncbi:hypothetical protein DFH11DRAFT_1728349 [Phellopilus nigrolimitatus]|nr:hypothetical protein DFH11DRAFT_1728349 [Phellopilus nigrolimitatus]
MSFQAKIIPSRELPASEAKWVTLKELEWQDQEGRQRRNAQNARYAGIDAVAILAVIVIQSAKNTFAPSTVIIEQYRPPMDK